MRRYVALCCRPTAPRICGIPTPWEAARERAAAGGRRARTRFPSLRAGVMAAAAESPPHAKATEVAQRFGWWVSTKLTTEQLRTLSRADLISSLGGWGADTKLVCKLLLCAALGGKADNATALYTAEQEVAEAEEAAAAVDDEIAEAVEQQAEAVEQQAARCEP